MLNKYTYILKKKQLIQFIQYQTFSSDINEFQFSPKNENTKRKEYFLNQNNDEMINQMMTNRNGGNQPTQRNKRTKLTFYRDGMIFSACLRKVLLFI